MLSAKRRKKITLFVFLIAVTITCLLYLLWWNYGIFTRYNYFTAKSDIRKGNVRFIYYGLPAFSSKQKEIDSVCALYGFKNYNLGCLVSTQELNAETVYNNVVEDYLNKRNGKNWRKDFDRVIDSLYNEDNNHSK